MDPTRYMEDRSEPQLQTHNAKEQMRFAPHMTLIRQMERLDDAMANKRDPWPAYHAWTSALDAWADEDIAFLNDWNAAVDRFDIDREERGFLHDYEMVGILRVPYVKLMRRLGVFRSLDAQRGTDLDRLRGTGGTA